MLTHLQSLLFELTSGNAKLFVFYFRHFLEPFSLPRELVDDSAMKAKVAQGKEFEIVVPEGKKFVDSYDRGIEQLGRDLPGLNRGLGSQFTTKQVIFWLIRCMSIASAFAGSFWMTFFSSLLQFLFLPYSLFVAICYGLETVFVLYSGHALVFPPLQLLIRSVLPAQYNPTVTIGPWFLCVFLVADQLLCFACVFKTPKGKTLPISTARLLQSVVYGFLNCKTYYLVLLPVIFGLEIPIFAWLIDAAFGLSAKISSFNGRFWGPLFYHVHRMGHIQQVYPDAHRFHHYLHDCTAFDAHIFGSGAPEEWLILMCDFVLALCFGCIPASLSHHVLGVSWYNKWGFHTRSDKPEFHADNFHADHHSLHRVNFGISVPFELFMKTTPAKMGDKTEWFGFLLQRLEDERKVCLRFTPVKNQPATDFFAVKRGSSGRAGGS